MLGVSIAARSHGLSMLLSLFAAAISGGFSTTVVLPCAGMTLASRGKCAPIGRNRGGAIAVGSAAWARAVLPVVTGPIPAVSYFEGAAIAAGKSGLFWTAPSQ